MDKKKLSNKHESDIAKALNGKTQIASGAIPLVGMKGDVITPDYLIECKATMKDTYVLKRKVIEKIEKEALKCFRFPLLAIRVKDKDYILFRLYDFFTSGSSDVYCASLSESKLLTADFLAGVEEAPAHIRLDKKEWVLCTLYHFKQRWFEGCVTLDYFKEGE